MLIALLLAATVLGLGDVESLAGSADAVVRAQVLRSSSAWAPGGRQIFTTVVLKTLEAWKGAQAAEITVLVPGGEVGDISQTVQGVAAFQEGEEVVVFLHRRGPSVFGVERMALGKFSVEGTGESPKRALRDRRGLPRQGCRPRWAGGPELDQRRSRRLEWAVPVGGSPARWSSAPRPPRRPA